jgi:sec-independent protein translocase protein TatA
MMGMNSIWHWLIVLLVIVLLFGAGRISGVMGDLGRGIKSFKKGISEEDEPGSGDAPKPTARIGDERVAEPRATSAQPSAVDTDKR